MTGYPEQIIRISAFGEQFLKERCPKPAGYLREWPPIQLLYLTTYLGRLGCRTVIAESHYIDRDYIADLSLFYARSLRPYENFCQRLHFFSESFDQGRWRALVTDGDAHTASEAFLQNCYLGFVVIRPLPGCPVGRTVLATLGASTADGCVREFGAIRDNTIHLAGFKLIVPGLAFQQQDQGVSACATTALWSALQLTAPLEGLPAPTPADITQAASRYFLPGGRALPSQGLSIQQMCEATRACGLAPVVVPATDPAIDKAHLLAYSRSGLPVVLALEPLKGPDGHAVCCLGVKVGASQPQPDPALHYRDAGTSIQAVYIHDDRLGPYAVADLNPYTVGCSIRTSLLIRWPTEKTEFEQSLLKALVVPVPVKLRLTVDRMRALGVGIAEVSGLLFPEFERTITMACRFALATTYQVGSRSFGLTEAGLHFIRCELVLSRYIGIIEITTPDAHLFDVLIDATETEANPSVLACVRRGPLSGQQEEKLRVLARNLGAVYVG